MVQVFQPKGETDFFAILGVSRRFHLELEELENAYYERSHLCHPDRFSTQGIELREKATVQMSLLNEAYSTLKDPAKRRKHLLSFFSPKDTSAKQDLPAGLPQELSEEWFVLQDTLGETSDPHRLEALGAFDEKLTQHEVHCTQTINSLEQEFDQSQEEELLLPLTKLITQVNYLKSLRKNWERLAVQINISRSS